MDIITVVKTQGSYLQTSIDLALVSKQVFLHRQCKVVALPGQHTFWF